MLRSLKMDELEVLIQRVTEAITKKITLANRMGELDTLLSKLELSEAIPQSTYVTDKNGKIVVIGQPDVRLDVLYGIIKKLGIDKNRFEFCLDYDDAKTYPYKKLYCDPKYRVVIFGPVPHSTTGTGDSSSVIAEMQNKEGYPRIEVLNDGNKLKITKTGFRTVLEKLINEDYI